MCLSLRTNREKYNYRQQRAQRPAATRETCALFPFFFFFLQSDGSDTRKYVNAIIITWRFLICFHSPFARGLRFASTMDAVRGRRIRTEKRIHETIMLTRFCANRPHPPSSGGGDDGHGVVFCRRDSGEKTKTIVYILENYRFERTRTILHWGSIGDVTTVSRA